MQDPDAPLIASGVPGLDPVLHGGLRAGRIYLIEGGTGTGKTTLGLQFLIEGARRGEAGLFISLAETSDELAVLCRSHGWDLGAIELTTIQRPVEAEFTESLFDATEVELEERLNRVLERLAATAPKRVVLDTLSALRAYGERPARFRRAMESLRLRLIELGCTVLVVDEASDSESQLHPYSLAWGVIRLEQAPRMHGPTQRRLNLVKVRGQDYATGYHDFRIRRGGLEIFPALTARTSPVRADAEPVSSGVAEIDKMLGGGLERGTSVGVIGPPGSGKSILVLQYVMAAVARGERAALYLFDESDGVLRQRGLFGADGANAQASGLLQLRSVGLGEVSHGELAVELIRQVEAGARVVVLDSLNGYTHSVGNGRPLNNLLHTLLRQLNARGAVTFLTLAQHTLPGVTETPTADLSYLTDTVIVQRYFEAVGEIRYALSVLKKRYGDHERTIREYQITEEGLEVGPPLTDFRGVLSGLPEYTGTEKPLSP